MLGIRNQLLRVKPAARSSGWQVSDFTSDASLAPFIRSEGVYSHALNFGYNTDTFVNGVTFTGVQPNTSNALFDCTAPSIIAPTVLGGSVSVGPNSDILCGAFLYNTPFNITLKGIQIGKFYRVSFFHYPWDASPFGAILDVTETSSGSNFQRDRAFYGIYSIALYANSSTITFNFQKQTNDSGPVYALICERLN